MALSALFHAKSVFVIFSIIWVFGSLAIDVSQAGLTCYKTSDCKPLLDSTIGRVLGSDFIIEQNVDFILEHKDQIDETYIRFLKDEIIQSILFIGIMVYIFMKIAFWLFRIGSSPANENTMLKAFVLIGSLSLFLAFTIIYKGSAYGEWDINPLSGTTKLAINFDDVFDIEEGLISQKDYFNRTMNASKIMLDTPS